MTLRNLIGIIITIAVIALAIWAYRKLRKNVDSADGLGDINTRGPAGTQEAGDVIATIGDEEPSHK